MFNVGPAEVVVILLVALIVFGPQRLPEAARTFGRVMSEVRRVSAGFQQEMRSAFEDADAASHRPESVPLASAVAEAQPPADGADAPGAAAEGSPAGDGARSGDSRDATTSAAPRATPAPPTATQPGVAPAVGEALGEIVGPDGDGDGEHRGD